MDKTKKLSIVYIRITGGVIGKQVACGGVAASQPQDPCFGPDFGSTHSTIWVSSKFYVFHLFKKKKTKKNMPVNWGCYISPQVYIFICKMPHDELATILRTFLPCPQHGQGIVSRSTETPTLTLRLLARTLRVHETSTLLLKGHSAPYS